LLCHQGQQVYHALLWADGGQLLLHRGEVQHYREREVVLPVGSGLLLPWFALLRTAGLLLPRLALLLPRLALL
jgi:hypothetical protein